MALAHPRIQRARAQIRATDLGRRAHWRHDTPARGAGPGRYAAPVAARCASVVLECQPELRLLMAAVPGVARVVARGEQLPAFDAHAPLMSLPARFGSTLQD